MVPEATGDSEGLGSLRKGARDMLGVLAQVHPRWLTRSQWALLTGVKQGNTFSTYLSVLRTRQLITEEGGTTGITDEGLALIGDTLEPLNADALIERWSGTLRAGARRMFLELIDAYPNPVSRDRLSEVCGSDSPNTLNTYMSVLRSAGLAEITADEAFASADLFM